MKINLSRFKAYKRDTTKNNYPLYDLLSDDSYNVTVLETIPHNSNESDLDFQNNLKQLQRNYIQEYSTDAANNQILLSSTQVFKDQVTDFKSLLPKRHYILCEVCGAEVSDDIESPSPDQPYTASEQPDTSSDEQSTSPPSPESPTPPSSMDG